jgi:hypothetical protein
VGSRWLGSNSLKPASGSKAKEGWRLFCYVSGRTVSCCYISNNKATTDKRALLEGVTGKGQQQHSHSHSMFYKLKSWTSASQQVPPAAGCKDAAPSTLNGNRAVLLQREAKGKSRDRAGHKGIKPTHTPRYSLSLPDIPFPAFASPAATTPGPHAAQVNTSAALASCSR